MKFCVLLTILLCAVEAADAYVFNNYRYRSLGCWKDEGHRAIPGNAVRYHHDTIARCADRARRLGNTIFAIQDGTECWTAGQYDAKYNVYHRSNNCVHGRGAGWTNSVYKLGPTNQNKKWKNMGCYRDDWNRAFKGGFKNFPRATIIDDCRTLAINRNHNFFGVENSNECFTGNNFRSVRRYGLVRHCYDGRGGGWKLNVYKVLNTEIQDEVQPIQK